MKEDAIFPNLTCLAEPCVDRKTGRACLVVKAYNIAREDVISGKQLSEILNNIDARFDLNDVQVGNITKLIRMMISYRNDYSTLHLTKIKSI